MPYEILQQGIGWAVVKAGTHQIIGRHKTRAEAVAQLRALYANVSAALADIHDRYELVHVPDSFSLHAFFDKTFTAEQRRELAKKGEAMPDGSFPTPTKADWFNARQSLGRAPEGKRPSVVAHLKRRAKALGIPDSELPGS